jgi:hypothetical protein
MDPAGCAGPDEEYVTAPGGHLEHQVLDGIVQGVTIRGDLDGAAERLAASAKMLILRRNDWKIGSRRGILEAAMALLNEAIARSPNRGENWYDHAYVLQKLAAEPPSSNGVNSVLASPDRSLHNAACDSYSQAIRLGSGQEGPRFSVENIMENIQAMVNLEASRLSSLIYDAGSEWYPNEAHAIKENFRGAKSEGGSFGSSDHGTWEKRVSACTETSDSLAKRLCSPSGFIWVAPGHQQESTASPAFLALSRNFPGRKYAERACSALQAAGVRRIIFVGDSFVRQLWQVRTERL